MNKLVPIAIVCITAIATQAAEFFVQPNKGENGDGSLARPFNNLYSARDAVNAIKKTAEGPIYVTLLPGEHSTDGTYWLSDKDSGTAKAPIIYRAQKPGTVLLSGAIDLPVDQFTRCTDPAILKRLPEESRKVTYQIDLAPYLSEPIEPFPLKFETLRGPWVYIDNDPLVPARWPNDGFATFTNSTIKGNDKIPGAFVFEESDRPSRWNFNDGVWLFGYWTHDWSVDHLKASSYDPATKVIALEAGHLWGIAKGTWGKKERRFYALNVLEELDAPGEYYLDRANKKLYLIPPPKDYPNGLTGISAAPLNIINDKTLQGRRIRLIHRKTPIISADKVQYIRFENLAVGFGAGGFKSHNAKNCSVKGCAIGHLARHGVDILGSTNVVESCDIFDVGECGVILNGGDRPRLINANNFLQNCSISRFGQYKRTYAGAVNIAGIGHTVRRNKIFDAPHLAILYNGNENLLEDNEVFNVLQETADAGAFYTGRDWTSQGNILRGNYIHDVGTESTRKGTHVSGIYLDDCDSGDIVEYNEIVRAGIGLMIGGGRDNIFRGNLLVENNVGIHFDARGTKWHQHWNNPNDPSWHLEGKAEAMKYKQPPWSTRYPKLAATMDNEPRQPLGTEFIANTLIDCKPEAFRGYDGGRDIMPRLIVSNNLVIASAEIHTNSVKGLEGFTALVVPEPTKVTPAELIKLQPELKKIRERKRGIYQDACRTDINRPIPAANAFRPAN